MDTSTLTADSSRRHENDVPQPALILLLDRARPLAGSARHSLANIDRVTLGRGHARAVERVVEEGRPTLRISLPDDRISSLHARIERGPQGWRLTDSASSNGCRVNRKDVKQTLLADGDVIEIGRTFFRYRAALPTPFDAPGDVGAADLSALPKAFATLLPTLARDLETLARIADSHVSVLLLGETGTGKEVVARAIHAESGRPGPFVAVNCGALPATLVESLLFGHTRGAFSGATQDAPGLVRAAEGGTLFLDEVGDLGPSAQAAMLRVLQEREVTPIGATRPIPTDVRVVSATHRSVVDLVRSGAFRQDLLARLQGFTFTLPELRARIDDVGLLVARLLPKVATERAANLSFTAELAYAMFEHDWPENVRELEQRLGRGAVLATSGRVEASHFWGADVGPTKEPSRKGSLYSASPGRLSREDEALHAELVAKLSEHHGNVTRVGEAMGKSRTQIQRWVKRLGIDAERFRA